MPLNLDRYAAWGRVLHADAGRARPEKASSLARHMRDTPGPAIGNLRSYGDAPLSGLRPAVDLSRLDRFLAFDPETGVLEAEAGVTVTEILRVFGPKGWMPATVPGTGFATLGGAIAADVHGKNHHEVGSFGQHVEMVRLIGPDGELREVTPESDPPLFAATMGGMGLTGLIESARIRLIPCPAASVDVRERRVANLAEYLEAFETSTATFQVGWIDATGKGAKLGRGIVEEAEFTTRKGAFAPEGKPKNVPFDAPGFTLAGPVVRGFNELYYRRIAAKGQKRTRQLTSFFHPLDGLIGWNKLYGKRGFHQFQCVLPPDAAPDTLRFMLREIADSGLPSPLAVLKKMGTGRAGPLSFPMAGYTLAVDFPNRPAAPALITRMIDRTADAGGRIYLAKDSLAEPRHMSRMYPELEAYRDAVRRADPHGVFVTDLARRLDLRGEA